MKKVYKLKKCNNISKAKIKKKERKLLKKLKYKNLKK